VRAGQTRDWAQNEWPVKAGVASAGCDSSLPWACHINAHIVTAKLGAGHWGWTHRTDYEQ
jgi:hypothetical protein